MRHPCRVMETRHCPLIFEGPCGDRPCARFESDDVTPWLLEQVVENIVDRAVGDLDNWRPTGLLRAYPPAPVEPGCDTP